MIHWLNKEIENTDLNSNSFDAFLCDPPYGINFLNSDWDFDVPSPTIWKIIYNVLKPGSYGLVYSGSKNFWKMGFSLNEAGFEIVDTLLWLYGVGFPAGNLNVSKAIDKELGLQRNKKRIEFKNDSQLMDFQGKNSRPWKTEALKNGYHEMDSDYPASEVAKLYNGYGTRLKPAYEPILLVRKPTNLSYAKQVLEYGNGVLNIEGSRIESKESLARKRNSEIYTGNSLNHSITSGNGKNYNQDVSGRWPANVILENGVVSEDWTRYFYSGKVSKKERNFGLDSDCNTHPTLKPIDLNKYLATLLKLPAEDSSILIPFSGVGSEVIGASLAGWNNITAIERDLGYTDIAKKRFKAWVNNEQ